MGNPTCFTRARKHYREHGLIGTIKRSIEFMSRNFIPRQTVIFYVELSHIEASSYPPPDNFTIERFTSAEQISNDDIEALCTHRDRSLMLKQIAERLAQGVILFLPKFCGEVVGFSWCVRGTTLIPYFFPFTQNDARIFDTEIFAEFRGHAFAPVLLQYMFLTMRNEGVVRIFTEIYAWNCPCLRAVQKGDFKEYARAKLLKLFGKTIVLWDKGR